VSSRDVFKRFKQAADVATGRSDIRTFLLGAVGVRGDGALVRARNESTARPEKTAHAEARLAKRLNAGSTVYVVRVSRLDGGYCLSRPCENCMRLLQNRGVKTIFYTISPSEYGVIELSPSPLSRASMREAVKVVQKS
jgi:deoxycytidylate deaminase